MQLAALRAAADGPKTLARLVRVLLRIEESFQIGDGVVVAPSLPITSMDVHEDASAELRGPDGAVLPVQLQVCPTHFNRGLDAPRDSKPYEYVCHLTGVRKDAVPAGWELWTSDSVAAAVLDRKPLL